MIFILNGLGTEFREISTSIRARESSITFEELHDKLVDFELVLHKSLFPLLMFKLTMSSVAKGKIHNNENRIPLTTIVVIMVKV